MWCWSALGRGDFRLFSSKLLAMYRGIARATVQEDTLRFWNSSRVVAFLGLPLPQDLLHEARLRYATSIYRSGPTTLWTLMAADKSWLHCFQEAFHWMLENLKGYGPDGQGNDWSCNFDSWCQRDPSSLKKWISKAARHAQLQHRKKVEWGEWYFDFLREAISLGLQTDFPILVGQPAEAEEKADACLVCHRFFRTRAAWAVHAFKNHQRTAPEREVIQTSRCEACMREYRTPMKLLAHLRHSKVCHAKLRRAGHRYDLLPGRGHRDEYKDSSFPIPVLPSAGPRLPRMANEDEPMDEVIDLPLLEGLMPSRKCLRTALMKKDVTGSLSFCRTMSFVSRRRRPTSKYFLMTSNRRWMVTFVFLCGGHPPSCALFSPPFDFTTISNLRRCVKALMMKFLEEQSGSIARI